MAIIAFVVIVVAIVVMVLIVAWGGFTFGARNGWFDLSIPHSRMSNRRARPTIASLRRARLPRLIARRTPGVCVGLMTFGFKVAALVWIYRHRYRLPLI